MELNQRNNRNLFSLFEVLLITGIVQGVVTSTLLFKLRNNQPSNRFLAFGLLAFCLLCTKMIVSSTGLSETLWFRFYPVGVEVVIGPLFYLYAISLITPGFKITRKVAIHFIPFLISQSYALFVYGLAFGLSTMAEKDVIGNALYFNEVKRFEDKLGLVSLTFYVSLGYKKLVNYRDEINNNYSDSSYPTFQWLLLLVKAFIGLGIFLFINLMLDIALGLRSATKLHWELYFLYVAAIVYYLGFIAFKLPAFPKLKNETPLTKPKREIVSNEDAKAIVEKLTHTLEADALYLNPVLNAKELAKILGVRDSHLSFVINRYLNTNFRDLINQYRIEEIKRHLNDGSAQTILSLALQCGFNSEATFYRVFKKQTGLSPSEYLSAKQQR